MPESRKFLVLGSTGHTDEVDQFEWIDVPKDLHVGNYDVVILSFLGDLRVDPPLARENFAKLIFGSTSKEVIALGDPAAKMSYRKASPPVYWWLPGFPRTERASVTTVKANDNVWGFESYLKHVTAAEFHLVVGTGADTVINTSFAAVMNAKASSCAMRVLPLATTAFGATVAGQLRLYGTTGAPAFKVVEQNPNPVLLQGSFVYWLPPPTDLTPYEAVDLILRERFDLRAGVQPPPDWIESYETPNADGHRRHVSSLVADIERLTGQRDRAMADLKDELRFAPLLYAYGTPLETTVLSAFEYLGADARPGAKFREDGWLVAPGPRNAVLEVKGRTGSLEENDLRVAHHWWTDADADPAWNGKAILVGNHYRSTDPSERKSPVPNTHFEETAAKFDVAVLTTLQLFHAVCMKQARTFDEDAFWDELFSAAGLCELPSVANDAN